MNQITVTTEKIVPGGYALGFFENHPVFIWNALAGETLKVNLTRKRKGCWYGTAIEILQASPDRIPAKEDHFLSCSPWQIIDYPAELSEKQKIIQEISSGVIPENIGNAKITSGDQFEYRNKLEMSFDNGPEALATLAFHNREANGCVAVSGCALATKNINLGLESFQTYLYQNNIVTEQLKNLVIRSSTNNQTVASLYVTHPDYPVDSGSLAGITGYELIYSDPKYSDTVLTKKLHQQGEISLGETILGKKFLFSNQCFFQVNIPLFETALSDIKANIDPDDNVYDMFSGVGAIGLSLETRNITLVELDQHNISYAEQNFKINNLSGIKIIKANALNYDGYDQGAVMICDPPRSGLTPKMIETMIKAGPKKIIYLSCNPITQMRDAKLFSEKYHPVFFRSYNFFPRTPHIESLIILQK